MRRIELQGDTIGRLYVVSLDKVVYSTSPSGTKQAKVYWVCKCSCGNLCVKPTTYLRSSETPSCGCWDAELKSNRAKITSTKHGKSYTVEYALYSGCKARAKKDNLSFDLDLTDILIPATCPVLGIPISRGNKFHTQASPSIDRFDNTKGYTKENIRIISRRANCLKNDATVEEMKKVLNYMKGEL